MATEVTIRRTGYEVTEASITTWLKKQDEEVKKGEPLVVVETEKVSVEIDSPSSGILRKIIVPEGKTVGIGETMAIIAERNEDISALVKGAGAERETAIPEKEITSEEKGVESLSKSQQVIPLKGTRKEMAERMLQSKKIHAHATTFSEADVSKVVEFLEESREEVSFTSLFVKASANALREFPILNSSLAKDRIIVKRYYHIGIAVSIEHGLIVPVIKNADKKSLVEITKEIRRLTSRAKDDALSLEEVEGGTFTISNPGMYGSLFFTPIINQAQSAILGVGKITRRPVDVHNELIIKPMVYLCLSYDHRVVDGALAQQFLGDIRQNIECSQKYSE